MPPPRAMPQAKPWWNSTFITLRWDVANMINIFFPEVIGLSGGVANQGRTCWLPCAPRWDQWFLAMLTPKSTSRITTCTLGYRAGVIGAALLAKNQG